MRRELKLAIPCLVTLVLAVVLTVPWQAGGLAVTAAAAQTGPYAPGSVPVIEQQYDIATVRGEEPIDMALSPDGRLAYVICVETDNLFVIDLATNQIVRAVSLWPAAEWPLGPGPSCIAVTPDGDQLVIGAANDSSLLMVEAADLVVSRRIPLGGQPSGVAVSPDGKLAYVVLNSPDVFLSIVEIATGRAVAKVPTRTNVGAGAAVALAPDGKRVYVAAASGALAILDAGTGRFVGSIPFPSGLICDLIISPDGGLAYVSDLDSGKVLVLDLARKQVASTYSVALAEGLALSADGTRLYVTTFGYLGHASRTLVMLDAQSGKLLSSGDYIHPAPYTRVISDINTPTLSRDGATLYLPSVDADGVLVVDATTLRARGLILVNALANFLPWRSVLSPDQSRLYVVSRTRRPTTVAVIDTQTREAAGRIVAMGALCQQRSFGLDISPDGKTLYVLSSVDACLLIADTQSRSFVASLEIPQAEGLRQVVVDPTGDFAYVLDLAGSVHFVDLEHRAVVGAIATGVDEAETMKLWADRKRLYIAGSYGYAVIDLATRRVAHSTEYGREGEFASPMRAIAFLPRQSQYVVTDHFGLHVYDAGTDKEIRYLNLHRIADPIHSLTSDIAVTSDGKTAYLAMWDEGAVLALDTATWEVRARIDTGRMPFSGATPRWLSLSPGRSELYVVCEEGDRVVVIDTATRQVTAVIRLDQ